MPIAPITNGNVTTKEQPGSPVIVESQDTTRVRRTWRGLYSALLSSPPMAVGDGFGINGAVVETVTTTADTNGGLGTFVAEGSNQSVYPDPIYEVESVDLQKDIITHPRYQTGGAAALTIADLIAIEGWKAETYWPAKAAFVYYETDDARQNDIFLEDEFFSSGIALAGNSLEVAEKIARGTTSYNIGYVIVRATTYHITRPNIERIYTPDNPPAAANRPTGYEWLLIADKRSYNRKYWTRNRVWMGVEEIDTDLYPSTP